MNRTKRILIYVFLLIFITFSSHFIYNFVTLYFESQRLKDRLNGLSEVMHNLNAIIISSESIDTTAFLQGKESFPSLVQKNVKGHPLYSWRFTEFLTLPVPLPHKLPWTADEYGWVRETAPLPFCYGGNTKTVVFAVGGPDTAFDQINPTPAKSLPQNLILFADVYESNTHWMQPGDFSIENIPEKVNVPGGFGSSLYRGFNVVFVDGQIWHLQDDVPLNLLIRFCTITDAKKTSRDLLEPYCDFKQQLNRKEFLWLDWDTWALPNNELENE
ncbi:hypothetical protein V6x_52570 [Gimesia chilikensis]|uniref:DUF1559 domain-containing protein n=1 Tax=Gimesia chilikensis TaxID=2605989 RepID=A0A517WJW6_9PLAN|nr:hypothetical protein [Gimesia chilikensis]QDU05519.1 hypothetical protein V6x_52570 [Gimesia chilikensis]